MNKIVKLMSQDFIDQTDTSRVRVVRFPSRVLATFMYRQIGLPQVVQFPTYQLPEGFKVLGFSPNYMANSFDFFIQHDSFDPVPEGEEYPRLEAIMEWQAFQLATPEELLRRIS